MNAHTLPARAAANPAAGRAAAPRSIRQKRAQASRKPGHATPATDNARLRVDVAWSDITKADGDVHVVGHYVGVIPQNAEWALDCALSGSRDESKLVLTDLTRRGAIRGSLGDVIFYPWSGRGLVALAGMGRLGTFTEPQLRTAARSLVQTVGRLLRQPTICTVLIGSGYGNLGVKEAVSGLLSGAAEAMSADPTLQIGTLRIVEHRLDKAYDILETVRKVAPQVAKARGIPIDVAAEVIEGDLDGVIPIPFGFSLMMASLAQACHEGTASRRRRSLDTLVLELPTHLREGVRAALRKLGAEPNSRRLGLAFRLGREEDQASKECDRVSFFHDGSRVRSAAITNMTTVKAVDLDVSLGWVDRIVEELHAPLPSVADDRAPIAFRHLVHLDLREELGQGQGHLVLELDRNMARVPWEMIHADTPGTLPLGLQRPVARQLRTAYSPRLIDMVARPRFKALVIGDPDKSLEYARREAQTVARILESHDFVVDLRLGPPDELGLGDSKGIKPADLYEVVGLLQSGEFDLVHYSGHAVFVPEYPDRSGWQFKGELLTPSKLEGVDRPPRLIVANACVSARLSGATGDGSMVAAVGKADGSAPTPSQRTPGDSRLVASLADEFFRRGVADYIGTAWEVPEEPAMLFAERFYQELLRGWQLNSQTQAAASSGNTLGEAVQVARRALYDKREEWGEFGTVWAAYQHYGDPTRTLRQ